MATEAQCVDGTGEFCGLGDFTWCDGEFVQQLVFPPGADLQDYLGYRVRLADEEA